MNKCSINRLCIDHHILYNWHLNLGGNISVDSPAVNLEEAPYEIVILKTSRENGLCQGNKYHSQLMHFAIAFL